MKKGKRKKTEMLPEYDFSKGIRGKYAKRYGQGTNIVNKALRALVPIIRSHAAP